MRLYKVKFKEWHIWGDNIEEATKRVKVLQASGVSSKIVAVVPITQDDYLEEHLNEGIRRMKHAKL